MLWALPSVRRLEAGRRALYTLLLNLPDDVILETPAVTKVVTSLAHEAGLQHAARALSSLARSARLQDQRAYHLARGQPFAGGADAFEAPSRDEGALFGSAKAGSGEGRPAEDKVTDATALSPFEAGALLGRSAGDSAGEGSRLMESPLPRRALGNSRGGLDEDDEVETGGSSASGGRETKGVPRPTTMIA